ncbi:MAG: hypothetical protein B6226_04965 [Candidatus Cloacimonetes bacterium 4572_65]|nr:MAG: hypothetical protein B6226_04965 [Candidatus Cloacimonetes bacterium 4572_65]
MIAIYIDNIDLKKLRTRISYIVDFAMETLGYSHKIIYSLKYLEKYDLLIWYDSKGITNRQVDKFARKLPIIIVRYHEDLYLSNKLYGGVLEKKIRSLPYGSIKLPIIIDKEVPLLIESFSNPEIALSIINYDFFGNLFFHLTEAEKQNCTDDDSVVEEKGIFDDYYENPIVNNMLSIMEKLMFMVSDKLNLPLFKKEPWPKGEDYALIISHSVDKLVKWDNMSPSDKLDVVLDSFKNLFKGNALDFFKQFKSGLHFCSKNEEPYWNFKEYLALDTTYGIEATWFISILEDNGFDYDMDTEQDLLEEFRSIIEAGNEVGLLISPAKSKPNELLIARKKLEKITEQEFHGVRILTRNINREIYLAEHRADILYDSSLTSKKINVIKNGIISPHNLLIADIRGYQIELPISFSDEFLKITNYRHLTFERAKLKMESLMKMVKSNKGLLCLDFSISNFKDIRYSEKMYKYTLEAIQETNYYNTTCRKLSLWWKARKNVLVSTESWGASVQFVNDLAYFSITVHSSRKIKKVDGVNHTISGNTIKMVDISSKSVAQIILEDG